MDFTLTSVYLSAAASKHFHNESCILYVLTVYYCTLFLINNASLVILCCCTSDFSVISECGQEELELWF